MKTFIMFLEEDNAVFKIKDNCSNEINKFLQWLQENGTAKIEEIKDQVLNLGMKLTQDYETLVELINSESVKSEYIKMFKDLTAKLEGFKDPSVEIENQLEDFINFITEYNQFIQAKIS